MKRAFNTDWTKMYDGQEAVVTAIADALLRTIFAIFLAAVILGAVARSWT